MALTNSVHNNSDNHNNEVDITDDGYISIVCEQLYRYETIFNENERKFNKYYDNNHNTSESVVNCREEKKTGVNVRNDYKILRSEKNYKKCLVKQSTNHELIECKLSEEINEEVINKSSLTYQCVRQTLKCDICDKTYAHAYTLKRHVNASHYIIKPFKCDTCGNSFRNKYHLKQHTNLVHLANNHNAFTIDNNDNVYVCNNKDCARNFKSFYGLLYHIRAQHTNDKPYVCVWPECGQTFTNEYALRYHKLVHANIKKFHCLFDGCSRKFKTRAEQKSHCRQHTHEKPYKCNYDECDQSFAYRTSLKNHIYKVHSNTIQIY